MEQTNKVVVTLHRGVDVDAFINEMSQPGNSSPYVPARAVPIVNLKPESLRVVDFEMTQQEMLELLKDQRVQGCRWGTKKENGIEAVLLTRDIDRGYFRRAGFPSTWNGLTPGNWALLDCSNVSNVLPLTSMVQSSRSYALSGAGVDIVIQDSGLQVDHPEFQDANGVSRVNQINWYQAAGVTGTMPGGFYTDYNGHGTSCGGLVAGKTLGWAPDASIYVMNILGEMPITAATNASRCVLTCAGPHYLNTNDRIQINLNDSWGNLEAATYEAIVIAVNSTQLSIGLDSRFFGAYTNGQAVISRVYDTTLSPPSWRSFGGIPSALSFDLIRRWHERKSVDPVTGYKRPTVVNMSWSNILNNTSTGRIVRGVYRGQPWTGSFPRPDVGLVDAAGPPGVYAEDLASRVEDCIDAGVILVGSAGNNLYKIDVPNSQGGTGDYDNYAVLSGQPLPWYYHRGATPGAVPGVVCVGASDYTFKGFDGAGPYVYSLKNYKTSFSAAGPRVNIYAPGEQVPAATTSYTSPYNVSNKTFYPDTNYYITKFNGTSCASPLTAGVIANLLGMRPWYTAADVQAWLLENNSQKIYDIPGLGYYTTISRNEYTDQYNLKGGAARYLYFPYQGLFGTISGNPVAAPFVMTGGTNAQTGAQNQGGIAGSFGT